MLRGEELAMLIPIVAMLSVVFIVALRTLAKIIRPDRDPGLWPDRGARRRARQEDLDETQLIQEMHRGLQRMEERVEALETILMDIDRRNKTRHNGE